MDSYSSRGQVDVWTPGIQMQQAATAAKAAAAAPANGGEAADP